MYNMKRIGVAWYEAIDSGMPCALHLNARTQHDYERLALFIKRRAEVTDVSFEFKTGAAWPARRVFHYRQLADVAHRVGKPLRMIMIGGLPAISLLAPAYEKLTFIDTSAFMKALYRQRLVTGNEGNMLAIAEPTKPGAPVDALLAHNIEIMRAHVERLISESRLSCSLTDKAQTRESPETDSSALAAPVSARAVSH